MEIGVLTAFLGGALSLLSPCGALLLPGFFASSLTSRAQLIPHGLVFYAGLLVTLVPLGIGIGALGMLLTQYRGVLVAVTSLLLIVMGTVHALGGGFDLARLLPGFDRVQQRASRGTGFVRTFLLGAVGGVAGFCAGPILGAVLTLAFGQADALRAGILLAVYGAGMVVPLMVLAAFWEGLGGRGRALLRGRTVTVAGLRLHTMSLVTGVVIVALGVLFWVTNGLVTLPSLVPTGTLARWQEAGSALSDTGVQITVIIGAAAVALLLWWAGRRRRARAHRDATSPSAGRTVVVQNLVEPAAPSPDAETDGSTAPSTPRQES